MNQEAPKRQKRTRKALSAADRDELKEDVYRILEGGKRKKTRSRIQEELIANCGWKEEHFWEAKNLESVLVELIKEGRVQAYDDYSDVAVYYWRR